MLSFRQYQEGIGGQWDYPIPKDKEEQLYDFYMLSLLKNTDNKKIEYAVEETRKKLLPYLKKSMLGAVFFAICAELRHIFKQGNSKEVYDRLKGTPYAELFKKYAKNYAIYDQEYSREVADKPKDKRYSLNHDRYVNSYNAAVATTTNQSSMVILAEKLFSMKDMWESSYGGQAWVKITGGWLELDGAETLNDMQVWIDHIYDLQHNTGTVFNKLMSYYKDGYDWILKALNHKAEIKSPYELFHKVSWHMRELAGFAIKAKYGTTLEDFVKKKETQDAFDDTTDDTIFHNEKNGIYIFNIPAQLTGNLSDRVISIQFEKKIIQNAYNLLKNNKKIEAVKYIRDLLNAGAAFPPGESKLILAKNLAEYIQQQPDFNSSDKVNPQQSKTISHSIQGNQYIFKIPAQLTGNLSDSDIRIPIELYNVQKIQNLLENGKKSQAIISIRMLFKPEINQAYKLVLSRNLAEYIKQLPTPVLSDKVNPQQSKTISHTLRGNQYTFVIPAHLTASPTGDLSDSDIRMPIHFQTVQEIQNLLKNDKKIQAVKLIIDLFNSAGLYPGKSKLLLAKNLAEYIQQLPTDKANALLASLFPQQNKTISHIEQNGEYTFNIPGYLHDLKDEEIKISFLKAFILNIREMISTGQIPVAIQAIQQDLVSRFGFSLYMTYKLAKNLVDYMDK